MPRTPRRNLGSQSWSFALLVVFALAPAARADRVPHAGMMRYPDVSATQIVFCYRGNLWLVPRDGGLAEPLAAPPSTVAFPRFSPDGKTVAFMGNYDGNRDLYTIPVGGGVPFRVTYHPGGKILCDWTPDGQGLLFFASGYAGLLRQDELLIAPARGGLADKLPVPYGEMGALSPDGTWLAYTPYTRDFATWKRYCGGMASDIWLFNLRDHTSKRITTWEGTDTQPMWHGQQIYYLSDEGPNHRLNIWVYDLKTGKHEQITKFDDFDVKWPAIGPGPTGDGEIVFQNGTDLYLLDLKTRQSHAVKVTVPGDVPAIRPQRVDVHEQIESGDISSTGKRAVFEARGDIWTVPAQKGSPRNLTRTSGVAERFPAWSPDGKWIVYLSDLTGEYELYLMRSDGLGERQQLTHDGHTYRYNPNWSPDSKHILFTDRTGALYLYTLPPSEPGAEATGQSQPAPQATEPRSDEATEGEEATESRSDEATKGTEEPGTLKLIDTDPLTRQPQVAWSHDSSWIAYTRSGENRQSAIWLYCVATSEKQPVTAGMFNDSWPAFDRKGDYLFFASNRHFAEPTYEDVGATFVYANTDTLVVVPLREKMASPWAPKSDEEGWKEKAKATEEKPTTASAPSSEPESQASATTAPAEEKSEAEKKKKEEEKKPLVIELAGFEERAINLPVKPGGFSNLAVNSDGKLLYVRHGGRHSGESSAIKIFDLNDEKKEEKTVLDGVGGFGMSADGKKILVNKGNTFAIVDAAPDQKMDKPLALGEMASVIQPREEWRQLFLEAWRLERDFFYDPHMHGVNWPAMRDHYIQMLDDCVSRADVGYVIRELISELNVGHAYYFGNDSPNEPEVACGLLGCDFELADGAYRIKDIVQGARWDFDGRGPLSQPGVNVKEGDYLLAVNGVPVDPASEPWAAFQGLGPGRTITLTVSDQPKLQVPEGPPAGAETKKEGKGDEKDKKAGEGEAPAEPPQTGQREVLVTLISGGEEAALRYRAWVEKNRAYVDEKTDGKVGYIHVPDTGTNGQNELFRQFYGQRNKAALIIDERWNGGGQVPDRFIELLNRPLTNMWAERDSLDTPSPELAHHGPKCMLINGAAGSGGDAFPYYFREAKLGKLIGMRTWGGLVGIGGTPSLIDGTTVTVPRFAFYKLNGTWAVEGHGVDPDIEVIDDPALMVNGGDPQLDKAIEVMLTEVAEHPFVPPKHPPGPDRSGMGVLERDR